MFRVPDRISVRHEIYEIDEISDTKKVSRHEWQRLTKIRLPYYLNIYMIHMHASSNSLVLERKKRKEFENANYHPAEDEEQ